MADSPVGGAAFSEDGGGGCFSPRVPKTVFSTWNENVRLNHLWVRIEEYSANNVGILIK